MPLLRSLAVNGGAVSINMALLTELEITRSGHALRSSPIPHASVFVKCPLQNLLLKWVLLHFLLVDLEAQAGAVARANEASSLLDGETFRPHLPTPGAVLVHALAEEV